MSKMSNVINISTISLMWNAKKHTKHLITHDKHKWRNNWEGCTWRCQGFTFVVVEAPLMVICFKDVFEMGMLFLQLGEGVICVLERFVSIIFETWPNIQTIMIHSVYQRYINEVYMFLNGISMAYKCPSMILIYSNNL